MKATTTRTTEHLQADLADLQSNYELLDLFLRDGHGDPRIPPDLADALARRAERLRSEIENVQALLNRR